MCQESLFLKMQKKKKKKKKKKLPLIELKITVLRLELFHK